MDATGIRLCWKNATHLRQQCFVRLYQPPNHQVIAEYKSSRTIKGIRQGISFLAMTSNHSPTLDISAYFPSYPIQYIISEWSALFPLVCHLANYGEDCRMVGELALAGHLTVGLFPKLGYLDGIWRLLEGGPNFLDRANAKSESTHKVWDVNWGSIFTRANGSAPSVITEYVLRRHEKATPIPEQVHLPAATAATISVPNPPNQNSTKATSRRHQDLYMIRMSRNNRTRTLKGTLLLLLVSRFGKFSYHLFFSWSRHLAMLIWSVW